MKLKFYLLSLCITSVLYADFHYYDIHALHEFPNFRVYPPEGHFFHDNLNAKKGVLSKNNIQKLNLLYSKEKMVRDLLLVLSKKYNYHFMQYVAMLTHTQLLTLDAFYKKYSLKKPETLLRVGLFKNKKIKKRYHALLTDSLTSKKTAAQLSVIFMKELIVMYDDTLENLPMDLKRELLKTNAFNKKVLRMFKKGLRNIEIGLPVE